MLYDLLLSDPGKPGVRSMGPDVRQSVRHLCVDLTDVTLADEDTNSILTDNANRAIQGNVSIQVTQSDGQLWNASGAIWCPKLQLIQVLSLIHI